MISQIAALIVDEGKWLPAAMSVALLALVLLLRRHRHSDLPARLRVMAAMNHFFGVTMAVMAAGHLLAVTTKLAMGTLEGSPPWLYAIGVVLAVPAGWLTLHARRTLALGADRGWTTPALNGSLAIALVALGLHNLPLAVPAALNVGYHLHARRIVGWAIVGLAVTVGLSLFIGSVIFLASGQSFEQFSGMQP